MPPLRARVNDTAGVLDPQRAAALEARLAAFEAESRHQIFVLTVPSLGGEAIEAFSIRVAEQWQAGDADLDNGVVVVLAPADRQVRIEVGYGLEGVIPDAIAARIIRERMIPHFRAGSIDDGLEAGIDALIAAARGEAVPAAPERVRTDGYYEGGLFAVFIGGMFGAALGRRQRGLGTGVGALLGGAIAFALVGVLTVVALAAVGGGLLATIVARAPGSGFGHGGFGHGYGGFGGGGFGGGGGGGFGGGGGGGFGGGGASGSW